MSSGPLHEQVYHSLRDAILNGRLHPGNKIPPAEQWLKFYLSHVIQSSLVLNA